MRTRNETNEQSFAMGMNLSLSHSLPVSYLIFQHMKQSGLASVIEAQEENFSFFLPQTERGKDAIEPVEEKHGGGSE